MVIADGPERAVDRLPIPPTSTLPSCLGREGSSYVSPRFSPYEFLSRCNFSTLTTRQLMVNFLVTHVLTLSAAKERKNTNPTLVRIELTTSALTGVQVTYSRPHAFRCGSQNSIWFFTGIERHSRIKTRTNFYCYYPTTKKSPPHCPALHQGTDVPMPVLVVFGVIMLYLEMSLYGKWLFDHGTSLKQANPSYQIAVVGNFLVASLGSNVSSEDTIP